MGIWYQIGSVALTVMLLVYIYPSAKHWLNNSPKAKQGDWMAAVVPLLLVVGFVVLLITLVR